MLMDGAIPPRNLRPARRGVAIPWSPPAMMVFAAMFGLALQPVLGAKGALLFLMAGAALVVTAPDGTLRALRREWLLVGMAGWCLMSSAWSDYPALSLRYSVQLVLTVVIGIAICQRVSARTFMKILLTVLMIAALASIASGRARAGGMGFLGIYGSKNALAMTMGVLFLVSVAVMMDRTMPRGWRIVAVPGALMGLALLVMGKSTGALVAVAFSLMMLGPLMLLRRIDATGRAVAVTIVLVLMVAIGIMVSTVTDQLALAFLNLTGKDVTLTGRTELWGIAFDLIRENPVLGVGYKAFWVHGNPLAETLWAQFGIESRMGFHFHNTLISNAVEIGLVGAAMQAAVFFGALFAVLGWALRVRTAGALFCALFMIRQAVTMNVEVVFFYAFDLIGMATIAAIVYGANFRRAGKGPAGRITAPRES